MIKEVFIPKDIKPHKYYSSHVVYLRKVFESSGVQVHGGKDTSISKGFTISIDGTAVFVDYSDHLKVSRKYKEYKIYLKYHYVKGHRKLKNVYPFAPISFYDWKEFFRLQKEIKYTADSDLVLNIQHPGFLRSASKSYSRRSKVQALLRKRYGSKAITNYRSSQVAYWKMINNCLVHVFIPGARSDILDRGHLQYLGLGCCTIAPPISDILPYYRKLKPGIHYVQMEPDYSNLVDKIEWCRCNRQECTRIGYNAQKLFNETCAPSPLRTWVDKCLGGKVKKRII